MNVDAQELGPYDDEAVGQEGEDDDDDDDVAINTPNVLANAQLAKTVGEYMYTIQFLV